MSTFLSLETYQYDIDENTTCLQFNLTSQKPRKNKQIVIALDISGSMDGEGINQAKQAISNLFRQIENEQVVLIAFDDRTDTYDLREKPAESRIQILNTLQARGGTSFHVAFDAISVLDMFHTDSEVAVLFFTDGQDGSASYRDASIEKLKNALESKTKSFEFHTIGFTSSHDVQLLTQITKLGSVQGTFQYVRSAEEINRSMENLIGLLTSNSNIGILSIGNTDQKIKVTFTSQDKDRYHGYAFLEKETLQDSKLNYTMRIESEDVNIIPIENTNQTSDENDPTLIKMIIKYIEKSLLDITSNMSNNTPKQVLNEYFNRGKKLQEKLAVITFKIQRMKNRLLRRDLYTFRNTIHDTLVNFNEILSSAMIGNFSNDKLATLNDIAYRSITNQCLKKKLDMRKQDNTSLFQESETIVEKLVGEMNFEEISEKFKDSLEQYGNCIVSCQNWVEALQDRDCLCIGLDVIRPEAAIKDPSLVEVKSVSSTMMTAESFLDSVLFSLETSNDQVSVHGGFSGQSGTVMTGMAKENISGVLPLYINDEHWKVAKEKMKSILGYIATLEPLGYQKEQLETIPFLVLVTAINAHQKGKTEFTKNQFDMILETCTKVLEELDQFESFNEKLINYNQDVSVRFPDSIPSNQLFLCKLLCFISSGKITIDSTDWIAFFQNMAEEEIRRSDLGRSNFSEKELVEILQLNNVINEQVELVRKKFMERKKENQNENPYISKMEQLLGSFGDQSVSTKTQSLVGSNSENKNPKQDIKEFETNVEIDGNIQRLDPLAFSLVSKLDGVLREKLNPFIERVAELLSISNLASGIHSLVKSNAGLVCLLIQSVTYQSAQKKRTAIEKGEYHSPFDEQKACQFVKTLGQPIVNKKISSGISQLFNESGGFSGPANQFIATLNIIEAAGIFHGISKGSRTKDFHILMTLFESSTNIPLVKEKITMMLTGYYQNVRLTMDKDGAVWNPNNKFCFHVWKNNKSAFTSKEEVISIFGERYRDYLTTVMRIFK